MKWYRIRIISGVQIVEQHPDGDWARRVDVEAAGDVDLAELSRLRSANRDLTDRIEQLGARLRKAIA